MPRCVIGLLWWRCRSRLMMKRRGICSERRLLVGLRGTKQNLGRFWIPTAMHFEPCSRARSSQYATGFDYRNGARILPWFGMRAALLSRLNALQGIREMAHGDSRTAVDTWLAGVHLGQYVSRGGPVIAALRAHAFILDNLNLLRDSARQGKLNEEQKTELSVVVETMPEDGFDWGDGMGRGIRDRRPVSSKITNDGQAGKR